jgi:uncharacterized protein
MWTVEGGTVDQVTPAVVRGQRIFDHRRVWWMSQDVFVRAADLVAEHEASYGPQVVVGIARGGLPLARQVGRRLGVQTVDVAARHNAADTAFLPATGQVDLSGPVVCLPAPGARLLVVDDICGTGATLAAVTAQLSEQCAPASVRTAVLCRNAATDVWVWRLRDWVVFPWESLPAGRDEPTEALTVPDRLSVREAS